MTKTLSNFAGWAGTFLILTSYLALALNAIPAGVVYYSIQVGTGVLMMFHGWERRSRPVITLNAVWALISAVGLIRSLT